MNLHLQDGTIYTWNVSTIEHYKYVANPVNIEPLLNDVNSWDLQLFPNPTSDEIKLKYNLPKDDVILIRIYDLTGKVIIEKNPEKKYKGRNQDILHLSQLSPGTYICQIIGDVNSAQTTMNIHQSNGSVLQSPLNTIDSITYTIANPGQLATLITLPIGNITSNSAISGGNITNNGGTSVTQRGLVWNTSPNPTTANNFTNDGNGTGNFTSNLSGLLPLGSISITNSIYSAVFIIFIVMYR